ncbi:MAG TPA: hypothetical protein VFN06_00535, partial [Gaiellaceae bacterium]|nr:hypothetical protein [Gaiellaceae bacterium]
HPGRVAVLFEGSGRAVAAQFAAARASVGGEAGDAAVWEESRARQAAARGRLRFAPGELADVLEERAEAVVRPASGVAYVPERAADELNASASRLFDAIRAQLDPQGVLAA